MVSLAGSLVVPASALALPPLNVTPPTISGTAQEGQQLSCSDGTWLFSPTGYAHQWSRDGSPIGGATGSTYTVQSADVTHLVTCSVTASNADGPSLLPATSLPVIPTASPPTNVLPPLITGVPQEGSDVSCSPGTWLFSPTSYAYAWKRDGSAIGGATSSTYTIQAADVTHLVSCGVIATNGAGSSTEATSLPVIGLPATPGAPVNTAKPQISGTAQEGEQLSCSTGSWLPPGDSYGFTWRRDGSAIGGATSSTYTVQAADVGTLLTCTVTATNVAGAVDSTSDPVTPTSAGGGNPPPGGGTPPGGGGTPPGSGTPGGGGATQLAAPAAGPDRSAPVVTSFSLSKKRFAVRKRATRLRYALTEAGRVELVFARRCGSKPARCAKLRKAGRLTRVGVIGKNKIAFAGRVGGRALKPGKYVVTIRVRDAAGNVSAPRTARFQVVKRKKRG